MKKTENLNVRFEVSSEEYSNPQFTKGRCKIAYAGKNRNGSSITKEVFEKALPTLKNIPVVGYYDEETEQFTGHIGKMEMKDGEFKIYYPTPVGVVPESCNPTWEKVFEEDGTMNEYLCCDVLLWTGRWSNILEAYENGNGFRQSMEIEVNHWSDVDGCMRIEELCYSSLCLLQNEIEPCFESSTVELFSLENKEKFKQEFSLLLNEIKNINTEEGDNVPNNKEKITDTTVKEEPEVEVAVETEEVVIVEENTVESEEFNIDKVNEENQEEVIDENPEVEKVEEEGVNEADKKEEKDFSLSHRELYEKIRSAISSNYRSAWVYINDVYDEYAIYTVEDYSDDYTETSYKIKYTKTDEEITVDFDNKVGIVKEWIQVEESEIYKALLDKYTLTEEKLVALESEKSQFEVKITELEKVNSELNSFTSDIKEKKRIEEINSIEEKFSSKIEENELKSIKDKALANEISVEDMENQFCKIFTMKSFSLDNEEEKIPKQRFSLEDNKKCPYAGLDDYFR